MGPLLTANAKPRSPHLMISKRILAALLMAGWSWYLLLAGVVHGQESAAGPWGFVRLLNAVSEGTGKLDFIIDGKNVRPAGYQLGNTTGGIALAPQTHSIVFRREGVREGGTQVVVTANDTTILIPFAEQVPASPDQPARWEIRILRLKQYAVEDQRTATFVSVAPAPEIKVEIRQADATWEPVVVKRLGIARAIIKQAHGYMSVRCNERPLAAVSVGATGNFVSVLYHDAQGVLCSTTFQDYKYLSAD